MFCVNYDYNKNFGLFKFHLGYRKSHLNSPKGYSWKITSTQTICCINILKKLVFDFEDTTQTRKLIKTWYMFVFYLSKPINQSWPACVSVWAAWGWEAVSAGRPRPRGWTAPTPCHPPHRSTHTRWWPRGMQMSRKSPCPSITPPFSYLFSSVGNSILSFRNL